VREVDCQKLTVDVVRASGGAAHKLSHRFLVGVCDLLVKFPSAPAALLEVKLTRYARIEYDREFELPLTMLQKQFLRGYSRAGMRCGVLSFIEFEGRGRQGLKSAAFDLDSLEQSRYRVVAKDHFDMYNEQGNELRFVLENFCCG
jgi:hypothetical protein